MLTVSQLECRRGDRRLFSDVNFSLAEGRLLHVLGPNGAGKTTLTRRFSTPLSSPLMPLR